VIYKLYVHPELRSRGIGPQLVDALVRQLPPGTGRVLIEHVAANERAAAFYERQGFSVDRVEPVPDGDPRQATVWRVKDLH
jgi:ribosomal protein S18 acetylase RimI-like enzyme